MKSKQINFYMMPEDVAELEAYIKQQGLVIIGYSNTENKPNILDSLVELTELKAFFILPEFIDHVKMRFVEKQNKYLVRSMYAPLIEYRKTFISFEKNIMRTGRLYYSKMMFDENKNWIIKNEQMNLVTANLFKWFKKHFKNQKINSEHTTYRVSEYIQKNNTQLLLNYE